jgi:Raf kinase inhibitor-like YbhB/YbcL family protein
MALELTSPAFENQGVIPDIFTCQGQDISPALEWEGAPAGTQSFALICDDPDAPSGNWVHWVIYNISAGALGLPQGVPGTQSLERGAKQGITDFQRPGYGGPCPPPGKPHRYFFKLYALDGMLDIAGKVTREMLLQAMEGRILAQATLMGTYQR